MEEIKRKIMKSFLLLCSLFFVTNAMAVCSSPIARTNFAVREVLTSARLNSELNTAYSRVNELPGDCITNSTVTSAKILDGTIVNADISASASIDLTKTKYAVALIREEHASGTQGSLVTATSVWNTRVLNTEFDPDGIVSLASNRFTLQAGTYIIEGRSSLSDPVRKLKLRNITDSTDDLIGDTDGHSAVTWTTLRDFKGFISGGITISSAKVFEIQEWTGSNPFSTFGTALTLGVPEVYAQIKITRIK